MTVVNDGRKNDKGMAIEGVAMPEFLSRKDIEQESWRVIEGAPVRGDAHTDITSHTMRVPFGNTETARLIRAHEMIHAKVSPTVVPDSIQNDGLTICTDAIRAAEEVRVNYLVEKAGFKVSDLSDGSERTTGKRIGEMGLANGWNHAILFGSGLIGTKALTAFLGGVASTDKEFGAMLRKAMTSLKAEHKKVTKRYPRRALADTAMKSLNGVNLPAGFINGTVPLATMIQRMLVEKSEDSQQSDIETAVKSKAESKGRAGQWALPIVNKGLPLPKHVDGRIGRKRIPSATGRNPRHLERLLTDPERRVFDRRSRGKGGVVLIDQSGSMSLSDDDIQRLINEAPGCVIIGYSHSPRSTTTPNIWIMADRGKVCESVPGGNGGNGVDGPAIRFALTHRRTGEPFVWVCDGYVTDYADSFYSNLADECAELVARHRIHMVNDTDEAVSALRKARTSTLRTKATGNIWSSDWWQGAMRNGIVTADQLEDSGF